MNCEALDRWCGRGILFLVLAILVFGPLAMGAVDAWAFLIIQALAIGVMLVWALRLWISPHPRLFCPPIGWVVLAFAVYAIGRYLTADIEYVARQETIQVLVYTFLFFAIVNNLQQPESAQIISFTLIFLAAGISGYAAYQYLTRSYLVWTFASPYPGRGSGTYISPNDLAGLLEMLLPLAVAYALVGRIKPLMRALLTYAVFGIMAGLAVTFSRGGWAATAVGLLTLLLILGCHRNHRFPALGLLIILVVGGTIFVTKYSATAPGYVQRIKTPETFVQTDWGMRRDMWGAALRMWRDHFWWGVGPGHYDYRFREYRPESMQMRPEWAHNDYLNLLADWGTVGGVIVLAGMVVFVAGLLKTRKQVRPPENDPGRGLSSQFAFFLGASSGLLALAVHSLADFNLHIPANAILGVTLLALLSSSLPLATERYWLTAQPRARTLATLMLIGGVVCLGLQEWRGTREQFWLIRAYQLPEYSSAWAASLTKAFDAEPMNFETAYRIGEAYRLQSFKGGQNYEELAKTAMQWYARSLKLDPYDGYNDLRYGMCLDWLGQHAEAWPYFSRAEVLDPNGYYTVANVGWHFVQIEDYAAARSWLARSMQLHWQDNVIGRSYLEICERKLVENACSQSLLPADFQELPTQK
ncbi:MAG TPA: O-antigen ligase family protein [Candidatus Sulfopaludibacter sp.]|nr:O-antigen ligase family protein [Candidatus Sulfopaludibacter sp.]